jgi:acyl-CoA reductase-like NAD-dependent aldehyde dehydrogenase
MSEALKIREKAAGKEYPQTQAAFGRVRAAAVEKMFATLPSQPEKREELYRLVHILDEVERELMAAMAHEMCHLRQQQLGDRGHHSASFKRMAARVCRAHGFDLKTF